MKTFAYILALLIPFLLVSCSTTQNKSDDDLANELVSSTFDETESGEIENDSISENDFFEEPDDMDIELISDEGIDFDPDYEASSEDLEIEAEVEALPGTSGQPATAIKPPPPRYYSSRTQFPSGGAGYPERGSGSYSQGSQGSYVVKKGDSLWGISRKFGTSVNAIASANNLNPNSILNPGKNLVIPSGKGRIYSSSAHSGGNTYVVKKGDSYFSIGKQFGISSQKLMAYNGAKSSLLKIGQTIRIP